MGDIIPNHILKILQADPKIGRYDLAKLAKISGQEARYYCKYYKDMRKSGNLKSRGIALYDMHYPVHDEACLNVVLEFMKDFKPNHLILGGDQLQMDSISSWNEERPKLTEGKRLKQEYKGFQKDVLDKIDNIVSTRCKKYFMIGNHEYRTERLTEKSPQYEGFIEVESNLNLKDYTIVPFNEVLKIGNMYFAHGIYWNKYYAEKTARIYQKMIFVGHVHVPQIFTTISPTNSMPKQAVGIGCLCNNNPDYMRNKPNAWVHQFLYWYMLDDGTFTYYTPTIINGKVTINGKVYNGNK